MQHAENNGANVECWWFYVRKFCYKSEVPGVHQLTSIGVVLDSVLIDVWDISRIKNPDRQHNRLWQMNPPAIWMRDSVIYLHEPHVPQCSHLLALTGWNPIFMSLHNFQQMLSYQHDFSHRHVPPLCQGFHFMKMPDNIISHIIYEVFGISNCKLYSSMKVLQKFNTLSPSPENEVWQQNKAKPTFVTRRGFITSKRSTAFCLTLYQIERADAPVQNLSHDLLTEASHSSVMATRP